MQSREHLSGKAGTDFGSISNATFSTQQEGISRGTIGTMSLKLYFRRRFGLNGPGYRSNASQKGPRLSDPHRITIHHFARDVRVWYHRKSCETIKKGIWKQNERTCWNQPMRRKRRRSKTKFSPAWTSGPCRTGSPPSHLFATSSRLPSGAVASGLLDMVPIKSPFHRWRRTWRLYESQFPTLSCSNFFTSLTLYFALILQWEGDIDPIEQQRFKEQHERFLLGVLGEERFKELRARAEAEKAKK